MTDELEPISSVDMVAAALRADTSDLNLLGQALSSKLESLLPAGMVEVRREKSLSNRFSKREGKVIALTIRTNNQVLELNQDKPGHINPQISQSVKGVVISRRSVELDDWLLALASELTALAASNANARNALINLLG
ncbi:hypothetical protein [Acidithrix ferrooxidans]|uniref:Uncharacterized protein n=1 Tax=Acidithrix ferrooxidans TaxID=1280514 RepID=A0A0D8HI80_9ACTN|nr:hypothetical protein [Acidithrix ferrooxidans]KJF17559.1 hypothetical protein AXFE_15460 [Acidithrix ferrooxidans]